MIKKLVQYIWIFVIIYTLTYILFLFNDWISYRTYNQKNSIEKFDIDLKQLEIINNSLILLNEKLKLLHSNEHDIDNNIIKSDNESFDKLLNLNKVKINDNSITKVTKQFVDSKTNSNISTIKSNDNIVNHKSKKKAIIFTMDSILAYEVDSKRGGAAGEIIIRKSLQKAFDYFGVEYTIIQSDQAFERCNMNDYDIIILDPWTWAAKGWVPKNNINGYDNKIYILDFFGSKKLRGSGLNIPTNRFLTAFGSEWNTFLGYYLNIDDKFITNTSSKNNNQGIIWGKDSKHFNGKENLLQNLLIKNKNVILLSTVSNPIITNERIKWLGHQNTDEWFNLLSKSKFLLGLGNPLLGPSAIDAISLGCMYINPIYNQAILESKFTSQHPYALSNIGSPYVCSYHENNVNELNDCIEQALSTTLKPFIPPDFIQSNYYNRVKNIFNL